MRRPRAISPSIAFHSTTRPSFFDADRIAVANVRSEDGEDRYKAIRRIGGRIFTVVYTVRSSVIRLISARRANRGEEMRYGDHSPQG